MLSTAFAQSPGFGKKANKETKPFRIFYFGYNMVHPSVSMGPELDFLWKTSQKISCETGVIYVVKKLLLVSQFGFITEPTSSFDIFVNLNLTIS